ncbi:hypothetical protein K788_0002908 [Paraburkholderia caribensis MBA4]|uniref:Uncharacterized protein n=1 Tax=Paraburkholderia caribensis MBA4 TaxID=1323664 RepID=A0A0P0RCZ9_9BURK|nr:hypothetical protein K788_0002908 [Paraburkholderia caribensis MBA4]
MPFLACAGGRVTCVDRNTACRMKGAQACHATRDACSTSKRTRP